MFISTCCGGAPRHTLSTLVQINQALDYDTHPTHIPAIAPAGTPRVEDTKSDL